MTTKRPQTHQITVRDLKVEVVRKAIKNLHLGVYPPDGRVRVAAPKRLSDDAVRVAVIDKLSWIRRQKASFAEQPRQSAREMVGGECHYYLGRRYRLKRVETTGRGEVVLGRSNFMELHTSPDASIEARRRILDRWYRERLKEMAAPLIKKWETTLDVALTHWGVRKMKTKWGSCNPERRRITVNLELAKKPPECLEYIVVHELAHLIVANHSDQFQALMDRHLPKWRSTRKLLNAQPLAAEEW